MTTTHKPVFHRLEDISSPEAVLANAKKLKLNAKEAVFAFPANLDDVQKNGLDSFYARFTDLRVYKKDVNTANALSDVGTPISPLPLEGVDEVTKEANWAGINQDVKSAVAILWLAAGAGLQIMLPPAQALVQKDKDGKAINEHLTTYYEENFADMAAFNSDANKTAAIDAQFQEAYAMGQKVKAAMDAQKTLEATNAAKLKEEAAKEQVAAVKAKAEFEKEWAEKLSKAATPEEKKVVEDAKKAAAEKAVKDAEAAKQQKELAAASQKATEAKAAKDAQAKVDAERQAKLADPATTEEAKKAIHAEIQAEATKAKEDERVHAAMQGFAPRHSAPVNNKNFKDLYDAQAKAGRLKKGLFIGLGALMALTVVGLVGTYFLYKKWQSDKAKENIQKVERTPLENAELTAFRKHLSDSNKLAKPSAEMPKRMKPEQIVEANPNQKQVYFMDKFTAARDAQMFKMMKKGDQKMEQAQVDAYKKDIEEGSKLIASFGKK